MPSPMKLQPATRPCSGHLFAADFDSGVRPFNLRLPVRRLRLTVRSQHETSFTEPDRSSEYISSVGSSPLPLSQWTFTQRHILVLNVIAGMSAISAAWLFFSAIPALLSLKRAAESMEKLMDVTREELPDTMAAIRLSGMEISDLTTELSDLGQEITQGVRSSTNAVRVVEETLRGLTDASPSASMQALATTPRTEPGPGPPVARAARVLREGIVKGRSMTQLFFSLINFSRMARNYFSHRA